MSFSGQIAVNPVSASVEVWPSFSISGVTNDTLSTFWVEIDVTRTTTFGLFALRARSATVEVGGSGIFWWQYDLGRLETEMAVTLHHTFVGIGGVRYIPSFPQLDRNVTTFPHAF